MTRLALLTGAVLIVTGCNQKPTEIGNSAPSTTTTVTFNTENAPTVEFNVPDMMCPDGCGEATREILAGQDGAIDVQIDFPAKTAIVAVDRSKFDAGKALDELIDHGFDSSTIKKSADK